MNTPGRCVESGKEAIVCVDALTRQGIEERALACIGIADEGDSPCVLAALGTRLGLALELADLVA